MMLNMRIVSDTPRALMYRFVPAVRLKRLKPSCIEDMAPTIGVFNRGEVEGVTGGCIEGGVNHFWRDTLRPGTPVAAICLISASVLVESGDSSREDASRG